MKKDLQILYKYLLDFTDSFNISEMYLKGEKEDGKMLEEIKRIKDKYNLK